ncbi:g4724 [Coccomyxa elongata]
MRENYVIKALTKTIKALLLLDGTSARMDFERMKQLVQLLPAHLKAVCVCCTQQRRPTSQCYSAPSV